MGAHFCFRSDSEALLDVVATAYGGLSGHRFPRAGPELDVELRLLPRGKPASGQPPPVRARLGGATAYAIIDRNNYVLVSFQGRRARVVASADLLDRPYRLRYELIEFAVFLLAARCQRLVPLHAACVGRGGRGVLLLGASGAGKSTLALHGLIGGLELLSEDAVFVQPDGMLATGVGNFLHVQRDALDSIDDDAARRWIAGSPTIRRQSGVEKFEADLRQAPAGLRVASAPLQLVGTVILSDRPADRAGALLAPATGEDAAACLAADQGYAMTRPGWRRFERWVMRSPVHCLQRGPHPRNSVDALRRLLA